MATKCFLVHETDRYQYRLRRYCSISDGAEKCPKGSYHEASVIVGIIEDTKHPAIESVDQDNLGDDPWPTHCDACGMKFEFSPPPLFFYLLPLLIFNAFLFNHFI